MDVPSGGESHFAVVVRIPDFDQQARAHELVQDIVHDDRGIFVLDAEAVGGVHLAELCDLLRQELGIVGKKRRDKDDIPLHIGTMRTAFMPLLISSTARLTYS